VRFVGEVHEPFFMECPMLDYLAIVLAFAIVCGATLLSLHEGDGVTPPESAAKSVGAAMRRRRSLPRSLSPIPFAHWAAALLSRMLPRTGRAEVPLL
jgi:hypothetical protein